MKKKLKISLIEDEEENKKFYSENINFNNIIKEKEIKKI